MHHAAKLNNLRSLAQDKSYYFTDPSYADLRELVCHERPIPFVLHYYFGLKIPYELLLDRRYFGLSDAGELTPLSNMMMAAFAAKGLVSYHTVNLSTVSLPDLITTNCTATTALIIPTAHLVASDRLVTSVLVEGGPNSVLLSSLRGDDFYIRRDLPLSTLAQSLALDQDTLTYVRLRIPAALLDESSRAAFSDSLALYGANQLQTIKHRLLASPTAAPRGAAALAQFLQQARQHLPQYTEQLQAGFHNVLLARVLWPMTFCYLPFVIACRRLVAERPDAGLTAGITVKLADLTGLAANLGHLFAKSPTPASGNRFFAVLEQVIDLFAQLEGLADEVMLP